MHEWRGSRAGWMIPYRSQSAAKSPGLPAGMRRVLNKEEVFKVTTDVDKYIGLTATADSPSLALSSSSPVRLGGSSNPPRLGTHCVWT
jgi:hypothetical protein